LATKQPTFYNTLNVVGGKV